MNQYIIDTKFAAEELIRLICLEEDKLKNLKDRYSERKKHHDILYQDFYRKDLDRDENFTEADMMHSFYRQADYDQKVLESIRRQMCEIEQSIDNKGESIKALSGGLLQIAKQGISSVYQDLSSCPDGRMIRNETLKNIIWQGRNQSLHYEEGRFRPSVINCFNNLGFNSFGRDNYAKDIIDILGWSTYESYESDIILLLN